MAAWAIAGLFAAGVALIIALWLAHGRVLRAGEGAIHTAIDQVPKAKTALVLGARVYPGGRLSTVLRDRVQSAIDLYKAGRVEKLLMSGDNGERSYDEVTAMRDFAVGEGVPPDDVVRDFAGFRTYDSIFRARELWGLDDLVIVTQQFHLPRALYIARELGMDASGYAADRRDYGGALRRTRVREIGARLMAWLDVFSGRKPHFLGEPQTLSGLEQEMAMGEGGRMKKEE